MPDEHADPVETATPSRSSAISSDSASTASKLMLVVFGTRGSRAPLIVVPGTARQDRFFEAIAQRGEPRGFAGQLRRGEARRDAEPRDRRHVLGSGAAVALVLAAGEDRRHARAALDPQRAGPFRAVELVRRERQQIDAERAARRRGSCRPTAPRRCGTARRARARAARAPRSAGSVPISLFACITETIAVSSASAAASASGCTMPDASTGSSVVRQPRRASALSVFSTASCSMLLAIEVTPAGRLDALRRRRAARSCRTRCRRS